jgi:hypothetical protein
MKNKLIGRRDVRIDSTWKIELTPNSNFLVMSCSVLCTDATTYMYSEKMNSRQTISQS